MNLSKTTKLVCSQGLLRSIYRLVNGIWGIIQRAVTVRSTCQPRSDIEEWELNDLWSIAPAARNQRSKQQHQEHHPKTAMHSISSPQHQAGLGLPVCSEYECLKVFLCINFYCLINSVCIVKPPRNDWASSPLARHVMLWDNVEIITWLIYALLLERNFGLTLKVLSIWGRGGHPDVWRKDIRSFSSHPWGKEYLLLQFRGYQSFSCIFLPTGLNLKIKQLWDKAHTISEKKQHLMITVTAERCLRQLRQAAYYPQSNWIPLYQGWSRMSSSASNKRNLHSKSKVPFSIDEKRTSWHLECYKASANIGGGQPSVPLPPPVEGFTTQRLHQMVHVSPFCDGIWRCPGG